MPIDRNQTQNTTYTFIKNVKSKLVYKHKKTNQWFPWSRSEKHWNSKGVRV